MRLSRAHLTLFGAVLFVSTAGPFLKGAAMDAYAVVFWRLLASTTVFLGWAALKGELGLLRGHLRSVALGSTFLTAHFLLWIKAFDLTDFASNMLLLVAQPIIAALVGHLLGQGSNRLTWLSVGMAAIGLLIITGGDIQLGPRALLGDALCVLAGLAITGFYVVTQRARVALPIAPFMGLTCLVGVLVTTPALLLTDANMLDYSPRQWGWFAALVLITTLGGHGLYNQAARTLDLFTLNIVIVLEPVLGIALGAWLFGATLGTSHLVGGLILGVSVWLGLRGASRQGEVAEPSLS